MYVTFDPYAVQSVFLALRSSPNACNWCQQLLRVYVYILNRQITDYHQK